MSRLRALALLSVAAVALAACGDGDEAGGGPVGRPGGLADDLFVEVVTDGGFVPPGFDFRMVPQVVVYADGTVVVPGAVPAIYPGPAVSPLATGRLDEATLTDLVATATDAGLLDPGADMDLPPGQMIADAPTTTVRLVVDGVEHRLVAPALGLASPETQTRAALADFVNRVANAATTTASDVLDPAAYRVQRVDLDADPGVQPNTVDWPEGVTEPVPDKCTAVVGEQADAFEAVLAGATEITRWRLADGTETGLAIRPVLAHETAC